MNDGWENRPVEWKSEGILLPKIQKWHKGCLETDGRVKPQTQVLAAYSAPWSLVWCSGSRLISKEPWKAPVIIRKERKLQFLLQPVASQTN